MDIYGFQIIGELESYKKPFTFEILLPILSRVNWNFEQNIPSYFLLHWYFDEKSCCVGLFHEWNEWMNPHFKFWIKTSVINVIYSNAEMEKKPRHDRHLTFHIMWKIIIIIWPRSFLFQIQCVYIRHNGVFIKQH